MPSTGGLGQVIGSGTPVTKHYDLTGVTKVTVDSGFKVDVDYGTTGEASVTVDDNLVKEHLKVELDGDTLHIGLADLWQYRDVTLRARVVLPRLTGLDASGASTVVVTKFDVRGSAAARGVRVERGEPRAGPRRRRHAGRLGGEPRRGRAPPWRSSRGGVRRQRHRPDRLGRALQLDVSGGSRLDLPQLTAGDADLTLSGGSNGRVMVTGTLNAEASGGSRLEYSGSPQLGTIDVSGGSEVEPD